MLLQLFFVSFCIDYVLAYYTFSGNMGDNTNRNQYPANVRLQNINPSAINSMTYITEFGAYSWILSDEFPALKINSFCYPLASNNGDIFVLSRNTSETFLYLLKFNGSLHLQNYTTVTDMMIYNGPYYPIYYFNKNVSLIIVSYSSSGIYVYDTMYFNLIWSINGYSVKQPIIYENYIFYSFYQNINDSLVAFYGVKNVENGETLWEKNDTSLYYRYLTNQMVYDKTLYINKTLSIEKPILIQIYAKTELIGYDLMNGNEIKSDIFNKYDTFKSKYSYKFVLDSMNMKLILYSEYNLYIVDLKNGKISSDLLNLYERYSTRRRLRKCLLNETHFIAVYYNTWDFQTEIFLYDTTFLYQYQNNLTEIYALGEKLSGTDYRWSPNVYFMDHNNYIIALNKYHVTWKDYQKDINKYVIYNEQFEIEDLDTTDFDQPSYDLPSECSDTYPIIYNDTLYIVYGTNAALFGLRYQYITTANPTKYPTYTRSPTTSPIKRKTSNEHRSTDVIPILGPILICIVLIGLCAFAIYYCREKVCKQKRIETHIVRHKCTSCTNGQCQRKRTCNLCNGSGKIRKEVLVTDHKNESGAIIWSNVTCTKCDGIGEQIYWGNCYSCDGYGYYEKTEYKPPSVEMK